MATRILIIDADRASALDISAALHVRGVETRLCADGQKGLDEARAWRPDAVVLCVELPNVSGYSVCNKLKKDEQLRSIPLLLTSADATAETFEQHRKLRTHADAYLLKPFDAATLVKTLGDVVPLPPEGAGSPPKPGLHDDDLELIDRVFDQLAAGGVGDAGAPEGPIAIPPVTVVGRADRQPGSSPVDPLRGRVLELEAEVARLQASLRESEAARARVDELERSARDAMERATAAEARLAVSEQRLRSAEAVREKARHALTGVLQALEEPSSRSVPAEVAPRRE